MTMMNALLAEAHSGLKCLSLAVIDALFVDVISFLCTERLKDTSKHCCYCNTLTHTNKHAFT